MLNHPSSTTRPPRAVTKVTLSSDLALPLDDITFVFQAAAWPHTLTAEGWDRYWDIVDTYRQSQGVPTFPAQEDVEAFLAVTR